MGWKSFSVFVQPAGQPSFGDVSSRSDQHADALCDALVPGLYRRSEASALSSAIYPQNGDLHLASYRSSAIICEQDIACAFFDGKKHLWRHRASQAAASARDKILEHFADREITALVLHSVVDLWGYAVYRDGVMIRCAAGAADDGIICDMGARLPEEHTVLRGRPLAEVVEDDGGEELVFEMSRRLFGTRLDEADTAAIPLVRYVRMASGPKEWLRRLIGR
jgi:hypothetical protein